MSAWETLGRRFGAILAARAGMDSQARSRKHEIRHQDYRLLDRRCETLVQENVLVPQGDLVVVFGPRMCVSGTIAERSTAHREHQPCLESMLKIQLSSKVRMVSGD